MDGRVIGPSKDYNHLWGMERQVLIIFLHMQKAASWADVTNPGSQAKAFELLLLNYSSLLLILF